MARTHAKHLFTSPQWCTPLERLQGRDRTLRTIMACNSSWDWNWRSPSAVSHSCQGEIEWVQVWRARRPREGLGFTLREYSFATTSADGSGLEHRDADVGGFALMLSSNQSDRTHFAWFSAFFEPLAQLSNVLHCPVNATIHDATGPTREGSKENVELLEQSSSSLSSSRLRVRTVASVCCCSLCRVKLGR